MALSSDLLSQFAKLAKPDAPASEGTTVTGTAKSYDGEMYVQLDGSDQLTPIASSTAGIKDGDRVTVLIKNHTTTVTGNVSDPSVSGSVVSDIEQDVSDQISEFEIVIADKVSTEQLDAEKARIDELVAENATIKGQLTADSAKIEDLEAADATITGRLDAAEGDIDQLTTSKLDASVAEITYAEITDLEAVNADFRTLESDYGTFKELTADNIAANAADISDIRADMVTTEVLEANYANIDFANIGDVAIENLFSKSGMIEDLVVSSGTITGQLVGVTISGDLIEGNTIKADKLVVLGSDGLYYKLNVNGESVAAEQTEYNSLNGSVITANTITAEKINVNDLVAFDATIGGFKITESSLYSGVKSSSDNTTRGVFLGDDGQFAVGDHESFLKYYKDVDGEWKLAISADSLSMEAGGFDDVIDDAIADKLSNLSIGGRNLIRNSETLIYSDYVLSGQAADPSQTDPTNRLEAVTVAGPYGKVGECAKFVIEVAPATLTFSSITSAGNEYVYGCWAKSDAAGYLSMEGSTASTSTEWGRFVKGFTAAVESLTLTFDVPGTYYLFQSKLELGNIATDWTPAPEDLMNDIQNVETSLTTRLEQTGEGWNFSFEQISSEVEQLGDEVSVNYETQLKYIKFIDGEIWLGRDPEEGEDDFKVVISNERIRFLQNNTEVAYISNNSMSITNATVQSRLDLGRFSFVPRANGNLSFRYVG